MLVSFHELAKRELNEAAEYYESESAGLGAGIRHGGRALRRRNRSVSGSGLRDAGLNPSRLIRRFPYALLYRVKPTEIRILALMNLKRRPAYWVGRS